MRRGEYQSSNYRQWITLPPQIPIPHNEDHLYLLKLYFYNLSYINAFIPHKSHSHPKNDIDGNKNNADFKIKTYWWGEQNGYMSLMKTLVESNDITQHCQRAQLDNQYVIKSSSKQYNFLHFQPVQFLICSPLQSFIKYSMDMKLLKIEFFSSQTNIIIAKTYLNFLSLTTSWKGQSVNINLPLFSPYQLGRLFVNNAKSPKIIGEISLNLKIQSIINPYKQVPKLQMKEYKKQMKKNQQRKQMIIKEQFRSMSQVQRYEVSSSGNQHQIFPERDEILYSSKTQLSQSNNHLTQSHQQTSKNSIRITKPLSMERLKPIVSIESLVPGYQRLVVPKHKFESEKIHLNEDFRLMFGVKNPLFQQIFSHQPQTPNHQTLQFKIQLIETEQSHQQLIFQDIQVFLPIPYRSHNNSYKVNQYILAQKEGVVTLEIETKSLLRNQIQSFIKSAQLIVQVKYIFNAKKQNDIKGNARGKTLVQSQNDCLIILRGKLSLLTVLSNNKLPNKVILSSQMKKYQKIGDLYITSLPNQTKTQSMSKQKTNEKTQDVKDDKVANQQNRIETNEYGWLKIEKFIPININYLVDANIYVRVCLLKHSSKQNRNIQPIDIGQTDTLWKAFGRNKQIAQFENQIVTFRIQSGNGEQEHQIKLQIMNRQQKVIKLGECLFLLKTETKPKPRGRMSLQVRNVKMETVGHLQCWIERGDINYINKLITTHLHHSKTQQPKIQLNQAYNIIESKQNQFKQLQQQHQCQRQSQQSSYSPTNSSHISSQNYFIHPSHLSSSSVKSLKHSLFTKFQHQFTSECGILEIHNKLFLQIIVAINDQRISNNYLQKFTVRNKLSIDSNPFIDLYQFCDFISGILTSPNESQQSKQRRNQIIVQNSTNVKDYWVKKLFIFYLDSVKSKSGKELMNFFQLEQSFQGYKTFYCQIIQEKDQVFKDFLHMLDQESISINELEEKWGNELQKMKRKGVVDLIRRWKDVVLMKVRELDRAGKIRYESIIEMLIMFYNDRVNLVQNIKLSQQGTRIVSLISDELRKYELYETSFGTAISDEYFKRYISKSIRELLQIDYYVPLPQLTKIIQKHQIELNKWEMLNLNEEVSNNKNNLIKHQQSRKRHYDKTQQVAPINQGKAIKEKTIVKSPTFGVLQQMHAIKPNSHYNQNAPLVLNNKISNTLNLSSFQQQGKQNIMQTDKSEILKLQMELISPINKINEYSNASHMTQNYVNLTQDQKLVLGLMDLRRTIKWVQIGKNTYFLDQQIHISKKLTHQSVAGQSIEIAYNSQKCQSYSYQMHHNCSLSSALTVIVIPLEGTVSNSQYNLVVAVQRQKEKEQTSQQSEEVSKQAYRLKQLQREDIFVNCEHGVEERLIDQTGVCVGSLIVCLLSEIQSHSHTSVK